MILNTGARTDTVQYFSDWLLKRFEDGYVLTRNHLFPNKVLGMNFHLKKLMWFYFVQKIMLLF